MCENEDIKYLTEIFAMANAEKGESNDLYCVRQAIRQLANMNTTPKDNILFKEAYIALVALEKSCE